jgi:hypothetical protein
LVALFILLDAVGFGVPNNDDRSTKIIGYTTKSTVEFSIVIGRPANVLCLLTGIRRVVPDSLLQLKRLSANVSL